jgi:hypothetical protein
MQTDKLMYNAKMLNRFEVKLIIMTLTLIMTTRIIKNRESKHISPQQLYCVK